MSGWVITLIVVPLIIGMVGEVVKKIVGAEAGDRGFRGVYFVTYKLHALVVGALVGLAMWQLEGPLPGNVFGEGVGGYLLAYCFSGGVAMVAYAGIVGTIKNAVSQIRIGGGGR